MINKIVTVIFTLTLLVSAFGTAFADGIVSFNKGSEAQIQELFVDELDLPEDLAKAVVDFRKANGPFKSPEDLIKVPGMTQDFIEEINPQLMDGDVVFDPDAEPALAPSKC